MKNFPQKVSAGDVGKVRWLQHTSESGEFANLVSNEQDPKTVDMWWGNYEGLQQCAGCIQGCSNDKIAKVFIKLKFRF